MDIRKGVFMKKNVLNVCLGVLSAFLFFSCNDDDEGMYVSYGVIQNLTSANEYEVLTDNGNTLVVTKSHANQTLENNKRVLVNFEILSDKEQNKKVYEVQVNGFYSLLSKPMVYESFILADEEVRRDSIGNDPFNRIVAWLGGDYINIDFEMYYAPHSSKKHMINLVYDDTQVTTDTVYLTLYHNAYEEVPGNGWNLVAGIGRSSFKIADIVPEGASELPVKLTWRQYENYTNRPSERSGVLIYKESERRTVEGEKRLSGFDNSGSSLEIK